MENDNLTCSVCHQAVLPGYYFCPNCGNNLKENPAPISLLIQVGLYALSVFLPPFGFWPGIKYVMKKNPYAKRVGLIVIALTLLSTVLMTWAIFALFQDYLNQLNGALNGI